MEEFQITSFKYGLDTRKDVLTSLPGTLVTCENAHINPGGEIEKRKAFVAFGDTSILDDSAAHDIGTFGIEVTGAGIVVFGSALPFGITTSQAQPALQAIMPQPNIIKYQQLKHPSLVNDTSESYNRDYHRMTQVVFSENFNGKAFVIAKFSDGRTFLYYDGSLVQDSANGIVMENRIALSDLANDLTRQFQAVDWEAVANVDENSVAQNGAVVVKSPPANRFTPVPSETAALGLFGFKFIDQDGNGTAGTSPSAAFGITTNGGTFTVTAPFDSTGTNYGDIAGGVVTALGTATLTAAAIASAINDLTFAHGYVATAQAENVTVYAPVTYGPTFTYELRVAYTGPGVAGLPVTPSPPLTASLAENPLIREGHVFNGDKQVTAVGIANVSGGTPTYVYAWSATTPGSEHGITLSGADQSNAMFRLTTTNSPNPPFQPVPISATGSFKCEISDGASGSAFLILTVKLSIVIP